MVSVIGGSGLSAVKFRRKRDHARHPSEQANDAFLLHSSSYSMRKLLDDARQAASSEGTVLLIGERNIGKSRLARQIHLWSPRCQRPFIRLNCTTLSEQVQGNSRPFLFRSLEQRAALSTEEFELIQGGTLFLANVEDLPIALQVGLADFVQTRLLETKETIRHVDVRIIASANRDLLTNVAQHRFREDLFYALNVISLTVPSLRERSADILPLAGTMLDTVASNHGRIGLSLSTEAAELLTRYHWTGNVRELRNAVEAAALLCKGETITPAYLPEVLSRPHLHSNPSSASAGVSLDEIERAQIERVLESSRTLSEAAAILGISPTTLWRKRALYSSLLRLKRTRRNRDPL